MYGVGTVPTCVCAGDATKTKVPSILMAAECPRKGAPASQEPAFYKQLSQKLRLIFIPVTCDTATLLMIGQALSLATSLGTRYRQLYLYFFLSTDSAKHQTGNVGDFYTSYSSSRKLGDDDP